MTLQELRDVFGEEINLSKGVTIVSERFFSLFSEAELNYDSLTVLDNQHSYGYASYIEDWRNKGLIS